METNIQARRNCLSSVPKLVTKEQKFILIQPFTVKDLKNMLKDLPSAKVPGLDGIPMEFSKEL